MSAPRVAVLLKHAARQAPRLRVRPSSFRRPISTTSPRHHDANNTSNSSVNPEEISHFNALAATWWDTNGSSRLLHLMNPLRHDFIRACHESQPLAAPSSSPDGLRYLDVGCGGGIFAESAARLPNTASVTAIDAAPEVLAVARSHARRDPGLAGKLTYHQSSIESLPTPKTDAERFDVVSVFEVVEHIDVPAPFLDRVGEFVKPGGWLVMSTIARTWMSWFTTNFMAEDVLGIVPKGTHDWNKYINEEELRRHFVGKGWNSPRCMGVVYVPGLGWKEVVGSEQVGNYFFAVRRDEK